MSTFYLDFENGNDANDGTTFAKRWKTITNGASGVTNGDIVRLQESRTGSLSGVTLTKDSSTVTLPAGNHKLICNCEATTGWTAATGISLSALTQRRIGSAALAVTSTTFTTGKAAYFNIGSTLDLSSYSALTFFLRSQLSGVNVTANITIRLCSDTSGNTTVNSFTYNQVTSISNTSVPYLTVMLPYGATLGNSIKSIAIDINSALTANTVLWFDAFAACHDPALNANAITPRSLFAQTNNIANLFTWNYNDSLFCIDGFIDDTTAQIGQNLLAATQNTSTFTTYPHPTLTNGTVYLWHAMDYGALNPTATSERKEILHGAGSTYSGGWNRTDMSTQTGLTVLWHPNLGNHFSGNIDNTSFDNIVFVRGYHAFSFTAKMKFTNIGLICAGCNTTYSSFYTNCEVSNLMVNWGGNSSGNFFGASSGNCIANGVKIINSSSLGTTNFPVNTCNTNLQNFSFRNVASAFRASNTSNNIAIRGIQSVCGAGAVVIGQTLGPGQNNQLNLSNLDVTQEVGTISNQYPIHSHHHNNITDNYFAWLQNFTAQKDTVVFDTGAASLKFTQTAGGSDSATIPTCSYCVAKVTPTSLTAQTLSIRVNRSNAALIVSLVINPGITIANRISSSTAGSAGSWETVTLSWTPTTFQQEEIWLTFYGTTSLYTANVDTLLLNNQYLARFEKYESGMPILEPPAVKLCYSC